MSHRSVSPMEEIGGGGRPDDGAAIHVPFPILRTHSPTDSETSAGAVTAGSDDASIQAAATSSKRNRAPDDDGARGEDGSKRPHCRAAMATAAAARASFEFSPEGIRPLSSQEQQGQPSLCSGNSDREQTSSSDEEEMEINHLDFLGGGRAHDPADQIADKKKAWAVDEGKRGDESMAETLKTTGEPGGGDGEPPSPRRRPIQVIMGWMDSFRDHEKIQLACLLSLPAILESPPNRIAARADGLASVVLRDIAAFPSNALLQLTAFYTLAVLLRPLGANEGTLHQMRFHEPSWPEDGARVILESMRRFYADRYLQTMGCWAVTNAALYPALKRSLLRLGGLSAVANAMTLHPSAEAVQFRGLCALINLVVPDNKVNSSIHSHVYQIARLTIAAMRNFRANESILNRGVIVLRNLSLTPAFVKVLTRTPGCSGVLQHCRPARRSGAVTILVRRAAADEEKGGARGSGDGSAPSIACGGSPVKRPKFL